MARREFPLTPEQEAEILELSEELSAWEIAWRVGCSKRQVQYALRHKGQELQRTTGALENF